MTPPAGPPASGAEQGDPRKAREGHLPGAGVLGMRIFLATLGMLFVASLFGYVIIRMRAPQWPPAGMPPLPPGLWVATAVIVACSVSIHRALANIRLGQTSGASRALTVTFVLGLVFLVLQALNWSALVRANVTATTKNLYAFTFYMLTGLHAAHVVGGLIPLGIVRARTARGKYGSGWHPGIQYCAMYWHFLDAVWLVLFAILVIFG